METVKAESSYARVDAEKCVCGYVASCRNHYALDGVIYRVAGEDIDQFHGIPRPAKWINGKSKHVAAIKRLSNFFRLLWKHLGFYFFLLGQFAFSLFRTKAKKNEKFIHDGEFLAIVTSQRGANVIHQTCAADSTVWFFIPWEKKYDKVKLNAGRIVECVLCLEKKDLIRAFFLAIEAHKRLCAQENQNLIMQTYTAFFWMCAMLALEKLQPKHVITDSHHDRWAVLVDCYASDKIVKFRLVQHGIEHEKTYEIMSGLAYGGRLPYRLKKVSELFAYDHAQSALFLRQIISENVDSLGPKITYFTPLLQLTSIGRPDKTKALFIGHPLCETLQSDMYRSIHEDFDFEFYYKPHPAAKMSRSMYSVGWDVIEDGYLFPAVDVLISYDSTLLKEYESLGGTSIIMHPMTMENPEECEELIRRVVLKLERIKRGELASAAV